MGIVALYFLFPILPTRTLVGSDVAHAEPLTLVAGSDYWLVGAVDWAMLAWLMAGSPAGVLLGSTLAPRVNHGTTEHRQRAINAPVAVGKRFCSLAEWIGDVAPIVGGGGAIVEERLEVLFAVVVRVLPALLDQL